MLSLRGLTLKTPGFRLGPIDLELDAGVTVLLGASGAGKTSLLDALAGRRRIEGGDALIEGASIARQPMHRRGLGYILQQDTTFAHMSVAHNVLYGLSQAQQADHQSIERLSRLAAALGLTRLWHRHASTLSGGEKQRVLLARTLLPDPKALLLDEPWAHLDPASRRRLADDIAPLLRSLGIPVLLVTHLEEDAYAFGDRIVVLEAGQIADSGAAEDVLLHPTAAAAAAFVGAATRIPCTVAQSRDGLVRLEAGALRMEALGQGSPGARGHVLVRPEHVLLSKGTLESSARNHFAGRIVRLEGRGPLVRALVAIAEGLELSALVTAASSDALGLKPGVEVTVSFKATSARFVARAQAA
jgi:molybdopterin-binding protein